MKKSDQKSSKKPDAWMPFYVADYLADTGRLTTEEHGAYFLMICDYWKTGPLPDDDRVLARITGMKPSAWRRTRKILQSFFIVVDGVWRHKRIDQEIESAKKGAEKRSEQAAKAAAQRWGGDAGSNAASNADSSAASNAQSMPGAMPGAMPEECPPLSPPLSPSIESKTNTQTTGPQQCKPEEAGQVYAHLEAMLNAPRPLGFIEIRGWLRDGIPGDFIVETVRDILEQRRQTEPDFIPNTMRYFDKAVRRAFAKQPDRPQASQPVPPESADDAASLLATKAGLIERGIRSQNVTQADVDAMLAGGMVTAEKVKAMGFRA